MRFDIFRRSALALLLGLCATASLAQTNERLVLGVSEGAAAQVDRVKSSLNYQALAQLLSQALKQPVVVQERASFTDIEAGVRNGDLDLVMVRPADVAARAVRDHKFRYVAHGKPDALCLVGVSKDSPIQKLADLKGKRVAMLRNRQSYLMRFCAADLLEHGVSMDSWVHVPVDIQGAVGVAASMGMADAGVFDRRSGAEWLQLGHRFIHSSRSQPFFQLVAGP